MFKIQLFVMWKQSMFERETMGRYPLHFAYYSDMLYNIIINFGLSDLYWPRSNRDHTASEQLFQSTRLIKCLWSPVVSPCAQINSSKTSIPFFP